MRVYISYIKKEFKENGLGELDGISFIIIAPARILDNMENYKLLKTFCIENGYEFILFNLNDRTFYKIKKGINIPFEDEDWYKINSDYLLNVPNFNEI